MALFQNKNSTLSDSTNPFATPTSSVSIAPALGRLKGRSVKELKKLLYRSSNLRAYAGLMGIVGLGLLVLAGQRVHAGEPPTNPAVFAGLGLFYVFAAVPMFRRTQVGRNLGYASVVVGAASGIVLGYSVGWLVLAFGFFGLKRGEELFGENRITHADIKEAIRFAKEEAKRGKFEAKEAKKEKKRQKESVAA